MSTLKKWLRCKRCGLYKTRKRVVLGKGSLPCDVLMIGEGPGKAENIRGEPFCGPSGRLLRLGIQGALSLVDIPDSEAPRIFTTNCVACRPCDEKFGPNREPTGEEMWACFQRLEEEAKFAQPKQVIFLGKVVERNCKKLFPEGIRLAHPSFILKNGGQNCALYLSFIRNLSEVFRKCMQSKMV